MTEETRELIAEARREAGIDHAGRPGPNGVLLLRLATALQHAEQRAEAADRDRALSQRDRNMRESSEQMGGEILGLRETVAKLAERFPCGHRKVDWDNSYEDCIACGWKRDAETLDALPETTDEWVDLVRGRDALRAELVEHAHWRDTIRTTGYDGAAEIVEAVTRLRAELAKAKARYEKIT